MSAPTFTCSRCGETFPKAWSDADALREAEALFGYHPPETLTTVCDDCFYGLVAVENPRRYGGLRG